MMCHKLGARKKQLTGQMREGFDYLHDKLITPDFYGILKEAGLSSARNLDGSYYNAEAQKLWESYKQKVG